MNADHEQEYRTFVEQSQRRLLHFAALLTPDPHGAQDLLQAALVKTYLHWRTAQNNPVAYVRRCMVNQRTDWWRRVRGRERVTADVPDLAIPDDHADVHARQDALVKALRTLTVRERSVVVLRYLEDLTEQQVADELGIALGTVKSTMFRALGKLRVAPDLRLTDTPVAKKERVG